MPHTTTPPDELSLTDAAGTADSGVTVTGHEVPESEHVLTPGALALVAQLHRKFNPRRTELLARRKERWDQIAEGAELGFLPETAEVRDGDWQVAPPAPRLSRRHVEITGPASRNMAVNALNSGADVWMADLEDAQSPTWDGVIEAQRSLQRIIAGGLDFTTEAGKEYKVTAERTPTILVRPRGWHMSEAHVQVDGEPVSASLFDAGVYAYHCAQAMIDRGQGPYFYLPKTESYLEARLWNDVFVAIQEHLGIPRGTFRATVLVETIWAAFEMEEILYELREHSSGLNAGRWDYIFSMIKTFRSRGEKFVLPDRSQVTMLTPFMRAYSELLVSTCHKRGAHAIGGMAAFVPNRRDVEATRSALSRIRSDKDRDARDGFDGSWVAHPDLVATCAEAFDAVLGDRDEQRDRLRDDVSVTAEDLLSVDKTEGEATLGGLRLNLNVALRYLHAWLGGAGAVAIDGLMEDAATVEISRSQVWQWIQNRTRLAEGIEVTAELAQRVLDEEVDSLRSQVPADQHERLDNAAALLAEVAIGEEFHDFFTLPAYERHLTG